MRGPNIRPMFVADVVRYRARLAGMIATSNIVKLSDEDLQWLTGDDSPRATQALLDQGPDPRVSAQAQSAGEKVRIADTSGAGNPFNATVLARLAEIGALGGRAVLVRLDQVQPEDLLGHANAAAAITVSRATANPPWADELARSGP